MIFAFVLDDQREHFHGSEKAIKRYRNMNKSGDVVTTVCAIHCAVDRIKIKTK
jgi:hypothetical protein